MIMDEALLQRITDRVMERLAEKLSKPSVEIEASGRHVHLTTQAVDALFGPGYKLTKVADLSQPGQFTCEERIAVIGTKATLNNVIVLGPERRQTQVEVSRTDAVTLGVKAPVRLSGDLAGTPGIRLAGPRGELLIDAGVIVAMRHVHMTPQDAVRFGFRNGQIVSVGLPGERGATLHEFKLRVTPESTTYAHIDYDEANACGFYKGMRGEIIT